MRRPRVISVRTKPKAWSFGLFVAALMWILLAPVVGTTNPLLLVGCVVVSFIVDGLFGGVSSKGVYIE